MRGRQLLALQQLLIKKSANPVRHTLEVTVSKSTCDKQVQFCKEGEEKGTVYKAPSVKESSTKGIMAKLKKNKINF